VGLRLGPGPVFVYEWLTSARRWQPYALRAVFVAAILLGMALVQSNRPWRARGSRVSLRDVAVLGEQTYRSIVLVELTLILLAAPAVTAGAVCLDKARGTLDHLLATDLSNSEIVLGKLGVRLIPVLGLVACALPVVALAGLLGGIDPLALGGSFLVAIGCALVGCALAMALSVYGRKPHEVLIMTYLMVVLWVMAPVIVHEVLVMPATPRPSLRVTLYEWAELSNPYYLAYAPYDAPGRVGVTTYLGFLAGCLASSAALVVLATARIRRVALSQVGRPASDARRWLPRPRRSKWLPGLPGPSLDSNPVAWREWHRTRPSRMMRAAWGLYAALGLLWVYLAAWPTRFGVWAAGPVGMMNMFQVSVGLLLLGVGAATSLAEERARGGLDVLLSTPMPTHSILLAKWWGSFRHAFRVAIWPAATTYFIAARGGHWSIYFLLLASVLAYGAAITSLGLAIATWVSRLGRAVTLCVTAYVILVIGWPIPTFLFLRNVRAAVGTGILMGDPPFGTRLLTFSATLGGIALTRGFTFDDTIFWALIWILAYIGAAALLYRATLATFDGCLGRIPDDGARPPTHRAGRSSLSSAELLALVPSSSEVGEQGPRPESSDSEGGD
jgi:ABC-type transport system involved in multi-copper enzyme maturation permease subunit